MSLDTYSSSDLINELAYRIFPKNRLRQTITYLEGENKALQLENDVLKQAIHESVMTIIEMRNEHLAIPEQSRQQLIAISTAVQTSSSLFQLIEIALDNAAEEIAAYTAEEKEDVKSRLFEGMNDTMQTLTNTFAACNEILKEV